MLFTLIVAIGWLYVALMMAVAEAASSNGSLLGAIFTFLLYGLGPVALVIYIMATPLRKKIRRAREAEAERAAAASAAASAQPDGGSEAPAGAVAPVRKEP
jgi:Zn-dependent protease with chaperone function